MAKNDGNATKFYGMKNDYMFKAVLQSAEHVLRNLVAVLLEIDEEDIRTCTILNPITLGASIDAKECILDMLMELNSNEIIDIELQVTNEHDYPERSLLYWSRSFDRLNSGEAYKQLKKAYHIGILDFTLFGDNPSFYAEYEIRDKDSGYLYSDKLNIRILDLTKVEVAGQSGNIDPGLVKWAQIFRAKTMEELEALADREEVFKEMITCIKELSEDEEIRQRCAAREDYERRLLGAYSRGMEEGESAGFKKGESSGFEQGITAFILDKIEDDCSEDAIINKLVKRFFLTEEKAREYYKKYESNN